MVTENRKIIEFQGSYYVVKSTRQQGFFTVYTLVELEKKLFTIDTVARNPTKNKKYDYYNVFEMVPREGGNVLIYNDVFHEFESSVIEDTYIYEKVKN